jgi:hypothetical protein
MGGMSITHRLVLVTAAVPLLLTGCSGSSTAAHAKACPSATTSTARIPEATAYEVAAGCDVTDAQLKKASTQIAKMPGVATTKLLDARHLHVELVNKILPDRGRSIIAALSKLGAVSVPS